MNSSQQLSFLDMLNIASFCIGLMNLQENLTQDDKQDLEARFDSKADYLLQELHKHLKEQDEKINLLLARVEG